MSQVVQVSGAVVILAAFAAAQAGWLGIRSLPYLALNLAGATVLAADAWRERQWGFLLLEGVWAVVSAYGLVVELRRQSRPQDGIPG